MPTAFDIYTVGRIRTTAEIWRKNIITTWFKLEDVYNNNSNKWLKFSSQSQTCKKYIIIEELNKDFDWI